MAKHTPAPWKTGDCDNWIIWAPRFASTEWVSKGNTIGEREAVAVAHVEAPAWAMGGIDPDEREAWLEESTANANLIAAAPEMLALLLWLDRKGGLGLDVHDKITAVISKAQPQ